MSTPITPAEVRAIAPWIEPAISVVNTLLSKPWSGYERQYGRCIDLKVIGDMLVCEEVRRQYNAAGWKVTITHDQRDKSFMTFMMESL